MQADVARLRKKLRDGRARLFASSARTAPCRDLLEAHTTLIDDLVREIYQLSCAQADRKSARGPSAALAIAATGGYGRRELSPYSDIDIAFIPSEEDDAWVEAAVHAAFQLVMDVFLHVRDIRVGYSYRPVEEAATWDLSTRTALLDARHLCGDPDLTGRLSHGLRRHLSPLDLVLEHRSGSSRPLYSVEPHLKEGPGSLRDLHRARWIYKLLLGADDAGLPAALEARGYLPAPRIDAVRRAAEWFWRARNWLHLTARKRSDVLIANYQERIARELAGVPSQQWLTEHFAHAETLELFCESAIRHALAGPLDLGGAHLRDGTLRLPEDSAPDGDAAAVRLIQLSQHYGIPIDPAVHQTLEDAREQARGVTLPAPGESWNFLSILREGKRVAPTLRLLARTGLMDRFVGGFSQCMRYAPPDPAHSYTVGEHSLKLVEYLEALQTDRDPSAGRFSELLAQCPHFDVLCLTALIHDAGKLVPGTDHCETAAEIAARVGPLLRLAPEKQEMLTLLARHHILLVRTARLQDLKSANVIQDVARKIGSVDALRHLYVFTYADTRAVSETNWTSMDTRDLDDLYRRVQSSLSGEPSAAAAVEDRLGHIRRRLARFKDPEEEAVLQHCAVMPSSYVLNSSLDEIAMHVRLLRRLEEEKVVLDFYNRPGETYSELTVCTYDDPQPGMLARIAGVLYGCGADIYKAQVFTIETEHPVVLDTLWVTSSGMQLSEHRARRTDAALKEVLSGQTRIEDFLRRMGKQPPDAIPLDSVDLRNDLSEEHTVVHVVARDLQGLLYLMTRALSRSGLRIHSARVATWNARAENNFYVTSVTGGQLPEADLPAWKEHLTRALCGGIVA
jgi:[protein-PII] uridylyltransferase